MGVTSLKLFVSLHDQEEVEFLLQRNKTLGVSKLRFLPKSTKVRPIVNLGSKVRLPSLVSGPPCSGWSMRAESVNRQLQDVFHVLNYEKVWKVWRIVYSVLLPVVFVSVMTPYLTLWQPVGTSVCVCEVITLFNGIFHCCDESSVHETRFH